MASVIFWNPRGGNTTTQYEIQSSLDNEGPWNTLTTVPGTIDGPNWDSGRNQFMYVDPSGTFSTWYRVIPQDAGMNYGNPTVPFAAGKEAPSFELGATPFGIYDQDPDFQVDADRMVEFSRKKLGEPVMEVHFSSSQMFACFEEACLEYSAMVNSYQAKSVLTSFLGAPTGSLGGSENAYVTQNLEFQKKLAEPYGDSGPFIVNTSLPLYSGSIMLQTGVQKYNLNELFSGSLTGSAGSRLVVRQVYHFSPLSQYRFFGTTSAVNYLNNQFSFESFTPETVFYLLPIWEDILRGMQFETSNRVRRSNYSFELHNNELTVYPTPSQNMPLWVTWQYPPNPTISGITTTVSGSSSLDTSGRNGVANLSNIPFDNIRYRLLNSLSKNWIRRFAFALIKEVEGQIRSKFNTIPIPNGDLTLNGPELIVDARQEQDRLREELRTLLDDMTYDKLAAREAQKSADVEATLMRVPLGIWIG